MADIIPESFDFNVSFLSVIEKYPAVYNYFLPEYSNRHSVEKAWHEISLQLNFSVEQCKTRWKHIRNSFLRHLRNKPRSGSGAAIRKPYYLQPYLGFLVPLTKSRKQTSNLDEHGTSDDSQQNRSSFIEDDEQISILCTMDDEQSISQAGENILDSSLASQCEYILEEKDNVEFQNEKRPEESEPPTKRRKKDNFEDVAKRYLQAKLDKDQLKKENDAENNYVIF